jgi:hypothetical protein
LTALAGRFFTHQKFSAHKLLLRRKIFPISQAKILERDVLAGFRANGAMSYLLDFSSSKEAQLFC